ncbi:fatty acid desaturase [uncultured Nevskia sp.]|uniref:fatty acid desaturase n=1 Tax=uncultured Nevskia sp. TaxID=228950 RepID=UPI0025FADA03|nr:fatty acid desaturase [uncultured Nevskia sp.]
MSTAPVSLNGLSPEQKAEFNRLTRAPDIAWPTVALWVLVVGVYLSSYVLAGIGVMPLWWGMVINSVIGYFAFSIVHDSIHRAISTNAKLNDFIGQTTVWLGAPYVDLKLFRWGHILHHRFTGGPRDPDQILHGPSWSLPFRWIAIDLLYLIHSIRYGDKISKPYLRRSLWLTAGTAVVFGALIANGYFWHLVMLWFVPSRMIFLTLGFSFFWLPHVPHDVRQDENLTKATAIRLGHEGFMTPALQYQNFHLIHHLYPTTPFYNNVRVWQLLEPALRQRDLAIQYGFAIRPTIHPAPATTEQSQPQARAA